MMFYVSTAAHKLKQLVIRFYDLLQSTIGAIIVGTSARNIIIRCRRKIGDGWYSSGTLRKKGTADEGTSELPGCLTIHPKITDAPMYEDMLIQSRNMCYAWEEWSLHVRIIMETGNYDKDELHPFMVDSMQRLENTFKYIDTTLNKVISETKHEP